MTTSMQEFIRSTTEKDSADHFVLQNERLLTVNLNGKVYSKTGSMVGYRGDIKFKRTSGGLKKFFKKRVTGERFSLMKAEGKGRLFLADAGKHIHILYLNNESIVVEGPDLLAYENTLDWDIKMVKSGGAFLAGGLFTVKLEGTGFLAVTTHGMPLSLKVNQGDSVITDPNATVGWSANLQPKIKTDIKFKAIFGRTSGEEFQMEFRGDGFVIIQPYEEGGVTE